MGPLPRRYRESRGCWDVPSSSRALSASTSSASRTPDVAGRRGYARSSCALGVIGVDDTSFIRTSMVKQPNDWIGLTLSGGRYVIGAKLGEGGMGVVYRARDRNLDSDVVIKVPR